MQADLYTLAYFSRNTIPASGTDLEAEIACILGAARVNNRRHDITGALLFSEGCFAQVLEGPLSNVETVFETIQTDPRHNDVVILHFKPIETRSFDGWSMAFAGIKPRDKLDIGGLLLSPDRIDSGEAGRDLVTVLRDLIGRQDASDPTG